MKVDSANRTAVLEQAGDSLLEWAKDLGKDNYVSIAKMAWLSNKGAANAYRLMVIYVTNNRDAVRLLQEQCLHVNRESAYTKIFTDQPKTML